MASANNETYVKLEVHNDDYSSKNPQTLFVKGTWFATHFSLSVLDGCNTWILHGTSPFRTFLCDYLLSPWSPLFLNHFLYEGQS